MQPEAWPEIRDSALAKLLMVGQTADDQFEFDVVKTMASYSHNGSCCLALAISMMASGKKTGECSDRWLQQGKVLGVVLVPEINLSKDSGCPKTRLTSISTLVNAASRTTTSSCGTNNRRPWSSSSWPKICP
ncbi:hypothetical protein VTI74DRAFT_6818 [Chaetomium olivicolor]